jgi:cyclase
VDACDLLLDMPLTAIVPGHGPVTGKTGVAQVRDYLGLVIAEATKRHEAGLDADAAIAWIDLGTAPGKASRCR